MKKPYTVSLLKLNQTTLADLPDFNKLIEQLLQKKEETECRIINEACYIGCIAIAQTKEGEIVGMVWLAPIQQPTRRTGLIHSLVVEKGYRRQGIGTELVKQIIQEGRKDGIRIFDFPFEGNQDLGSKFCESLGFIFLGNSYRLTF